MAEAALIGVGSRILGEWIEDRPVAYHIRRRLTPGEQVLVGEVVDVRGTPAADERATKLLDIYEHSEHYAMIESAVRQELEGRVIAPPS